jgi:signal transduction histidine kinase
MALRGFSVESAAQLTLPIRSGSVYYQITASRSPLMLDDVTRHSDWQQAEFLHKDRSWIGVPLLVRNQVTGILTLSRQTAGQFSSEDMMLAWAYAGQAAVALENARLYHELSTLNNDLEKLVSLRTQELEKANLALERADKIKSDFITVAAHEMRTPLTLIKGYTDLLKTQFADNADASKLLQGIESGEARMLDVVTSMLDISKIENQVLQVSKEPVIFRDVVSDIQQVFEKALQERKIQVDRRALDTLPPLWADPELLHKLIYQLMSNAIKYTPDGGTITLRGQMIPATESTTQKAMTEIVIQDTGIGINPEYHEQIFEKFFQTGQVKLHSTSRTNFKGGGPGLGLTIARGIVLAHGGRIWVESPGYDETTCPGSAFHILLPNE